MQQTINGPGVVLLDAVGGSACDLVDLAFTQISGAVQWIAYDSPAIESFVPETNPISGVVTEPPSIATGSAFSPADYVVNAPYSTGLVLVLTGAACTVVVHWKSATG
jgi:hypothetical protein